MVNDQDEDVEEVEVPLVMFTQNDKQLLLGLARKLAATLQDENVSIGDGIAAMMILTNTQLGAMRDEGNRIEALSMCVSVLSGNFEYEGTIN